MKDLGQEKSQKQPSKSRARTKRAPAAGASADASKPNNTLTSQEVQLEKAPATKKNPPKKTDPKISEKVPAQTSKKASEQAEKRTAVENAVKTEKIDAKASPQKQNRTTKKVKKPALSVQKVSENQTESPQNPTTPMGQKWTKKSTSDKKTFTKTEPQKVQGAVTAQNGPTPEYQFPAETLIAADPEKQNVTPVQKILTTPELLDAFEKNQITEVENHLLPVLGAAQKSQDILFLSSQEDDAQLLLNVLLAKYAVSQRKGGALVLFPTTAQAKAAWEKTQKILNALPKPPTTLVWDSQTEIDTSGSPSVFAGLDQGKAIFDSLQWQPSALILINTENMSPEICRNKIQDCIKKWSQNNVLQKVFVAAQNPSWLQEWSFQLCDRLFYVYELPAINREKNPEQCGYALSRTKKFQTLHALLKEDKGPAIVYTNTTSVAKWLGFKLHHNGLKVEIVGPDLSASQKNQLIDAVNKGEVHAIIVSAEDYKALPLENVAHIYQFDVPVKPRIYLQRLQSIENHKKALSTLLICEDYGYYMKDLESTLDYQIPLKEAKTQWAALKDESPYPLKADGSIKSIIDQAEEKTTDSPVESTPVVTPARHRPDTSQEHKTYSTQTFGAPSAQSQPAKNKTATTAETSMDSESTRAAPAADRPSADRTTQRRFVRRDERAQQVAQSIRENLKPAQENTTQHKTEQPQTEAAPKEGAQPPLSPRKVVSLSVEILQEALSAGAAAAADSVVKNVEKKMPQLASLLKKWKK